ncbi:unnamed protein product [Mytilus edulis]|uniref:Uncharacterized protein n=1 Tax=Mytilus edulis TaxID=6550 RepID=A0A8S3UF77_MYTED|nr:unnamed protein product [Mytilus edulis]
MATIRDEDGSVTNLATIQQIVKPGLFYTTPSCIYRKNWNMAMCPYKYAKLNIKIDASSPEHGQTESIMVRDDQPDSPETLTGVFSNEFLTILGGTHSYTLHWSGKQSQYRSCNNPATAIGGTDCVGDGVNSVSCNEHPCLIGDNGHHVSSILVVKVTEKGKGHAILPAPQHGGIHCTGSVEDQEACNNCT